MKKNIYKSILLVAVITVMAIIASSCKDDNSDNGGAPYISYIRVPDPASADSLLQAAGQGQLIAIVGGNLGSTRQVWFNDQQSLLTPTYVSNSVVFATVPSQLPSVVTNQLKLIFANGDSLLYDFTVTINKPAINGSSNATSVGMDCEYVADGDIATIYGQYFYLPITVTFEGGATASSETGDVTANSSSTILSVKVPEGAQPGQITVTNSIGSAKSDFWFRDNRNIVQGFEGDPTSSDPYSDLGTNGGVIVSNDASVTSPSVSIVSPGDGYPPIINGNYLRMVFNAQTWWAQLFCNWNNGNTSIPDEAIIDPNSYYLKFEVCTTKPYNGSGMKLWLTDMATQNSTFYPVGTSNTIQYGWNPPFDSKGVWATVTIPLEDIASAQASGGVNYFPSVQSSGYFFGFVFAGSDPLDCDMSFDNFRIVPKTIR